MSIGELSRSEAIELGLEGYKYVPAIKSIQEK
jgi:hypothetical protein